MRGRVIAANAVQTRSGAASSRLVPRQTRHVARRLTGARPSPSTSCSLTLETAPAAGSRRVLNAVLTCRSRWPTYLTWMRSSSLVPPCRLVLHEAGGGVGEAQLRETALVAKQLGVDPKVLHRRAQIAMLSGSLGATRSTTLSRPWRRSVCDTIPLRTSPYSNSPSRRWILLVLPAPSRSSTRGCESNTCRR
jgi:hypothetical protein